MRRYFGRFRHPQSLPCQDLYPASAKIIISLCGERLLLSRLSEKATEAVPLYISCIKGTRPGKTPSCRPPLTTVICGGELYIPRKVLQGAFTLSLTVYPYTPTVTERLSSCHSPAAEQIVRKPHRNYTALHCRNTASRYIRISAV